MNSANPVPPAVLTDKLRADLATVSTATLTSLLQRRGIRNTFLSGLRPLRQGQTMVGRARTLRYLPLREDLQSTYGGVNNAQRRAVEGIEPGDVLIVDARGVPDAGTIGDIFATRVHRLGGVGIITDGSLRDTPGVAQVPIPVYYGSSHAATLARAHVPYSTDDAIACAGVFVEPGDVIVGDDEGAVVVPAALIEEITADAVAQELAEEWGLERVRAGDDSRDVFPIAKSRRAEFEAWKAERAANPPTPTSEPERRSIEIDRVSHLTAIPVASRIGPLLVSSIIAPFDPGTRDVPDSPEQQVENLFGHVGAMLADAGASWTDVIKMNFWVSDAAHRSVLERSWTRRFPDPRSRPARHTQVADNGGPAISADFTAYIAEHGTADR